MSQLAVFTLRQAAAVIEAHTPGATVVDDPTLRVPALRPRTNPRRAVLIRIVAAVVQTVR
jgi:hypothetical protein